MLIAEGFVSVTKTMKMPRRMRTNAKRETAFLVSPLKLSSDGTLWRSYCPTWQELGHLAQRLNRLLRRAKPRSCPVHCGSAGLPHTRPAMSNLYSVTKGQSAIGDLFSVKHDRAVNLPLLPAIFPDQIAPIVRVAVGGARELVMARWGMPGPPQYGGQPVTNIRNAKTPHWRGWLGRRNRCIVPATSFCEYLDTEPRKTSIWFALGEDRPLFAFAGLWTPWRGLRGPKSAPVEGEHELFGFLTTEANAVVAPVHEKAMPVILTTPAEVDRWLEAEISDALALQRPPSDALRIVAKGEKTNGSPAVGAALRRKHPVLAFEFRKPLTITGRRSGEIRPCSLAKVQNRLSHPGMFGTRGILRRGP